MDYFNFLSNSLIFSNFLQVLRALDDTILLLLVSLPIGFVLSLLFALGRVSNNYILSSGSINITNIVFIT